MIEYRKATRQDARAIHRLIRQVGINPLGLDWRRFLLAIDEQGQVIGCGQVKPHGADLRELASIAVSPQHQGQGIGSQIIQKLLTETPLPLYLYCRAELESYYQKFGFQPVPPQIMPDYFYRIWRIFDILQKVVPSLGGLKIMVKTA